MLVPLLRVLPLSKSENMFLVAVVCVCGGGGGGIVRCLSDWIFLVTIPWKTSRHA